MRVMEVMDRWLELERVLVAQVVRPLFQVQVTLRMSVDLSDGYKRERFLVRLQQEM